MWKMNRTGWIYNLIILKYAVDIRLFRDVYQPKYKNYNKIKHWVYFVVYIIMNTKI